MKEFGTMRNGTMKADTKDGSITYRAWDKLRDGREIMIRSAGLSDQPILKEIIKHLSPDGRYFRYLMVKDTPSPVELHSFSIMDLQCHVALIACRMEKGREIHLGIAEYCVTDDQHTTAEIAFAVEDEHQGLGVGTALFNHLAIVARQAGIQKFTALVHSQNKKMLNVFEHSIYKVRTRRVSPALAVTIWLDVRRDDVHQP